MNTRASSRHQQGFTLAEVLIALALLGAAGIGATSLLAHLTSSNVEAHEQVYRHGVATAVMESLMVREFADLAIGSTSGSATGGESWTITISDEGTDLRRLRVDVAARGRNTILETLISNRF